jgi:hypothetical protein
MFSSRHAGETNVPAVLLSTAVLIFAIAAAYYMVAVLPYNGTSIDIDASTSSSSSMMSVSAQSAAPATSAVSSRAFDQAAYDGCLNAATEAHNLRWAAACTQHRETQESAYLACVNQGKGEDYCKAQFGGYEEIDANCVLPLVRTNTLNAQFALGKEACNQQYGR